MRNFKFDNRSRDRKDSPRRGSGGGDSRRFSMHDAVCDECGKDCQVPFKPSSGKPIYCSDCFEKKGGRDSRPSRRDSHKRSFGDRDPGRSPNNISDRSASQLIEKIEILNTKLETIINLLSSAGQKKSDTVVDRREKIKKSKSTKADKVPEVLTTVKDKDTDLKVDDAQGNIISKPKKRAKTKTDPLPKTESKVEEKPQSVETVNPDNKLSGD